MLYDFEYKLFYPRLKEKLNIFLFDVSKEITVGGHPGNEINVRNIKYVSKNYTQLVVLHD